MQGNGPSRWWYAGIGVAVGFTFAAAISVVAVPDRVSGDQERSPGKPLGPAEAASSGARSQAGAGSSSSRPTRRTVPPIGSMAASTENPVPATFELEPGHDAGSERARVVGSTDTADSDQTDPTPLDDPSSAPDVALSNAGESVAGSSPVAGWTPATARTYWVDYLRPRLDLTLAIEDALRTVLDERRWPFDQWDPGQLRTMIGEADDPVLRLALSEPFRQFEEYLNPEQRAIFQQIAPRRDPARGTLEVRLVADSAQVAAAAPDPVPATTPGPAAREPSVPTPRNGYGTPNPGGR